MIMSLHHPTLDITCLCYYGNELYLMNDSVPKNTPGGKDSGNYNKWLPIVHQRRDHDGPWDWVLCGYRERHSSRASWFPGILALLLCKHHHLSAVPGSCSRVPNPRGHCDNDFGARWGPLAQRSYNYNKINSIAFWCSLRYVAPRPPVPPAKHAKLQAGSFLLRFSQLTDDFTINSFNYRVLQVSCY